MELMMRGTYFAELSAFVAVAEQAPLLLLSVVYSFWVAKFVAFNGDTMRDFAGYFQGLAKKQETPAPKMIAHRVVGTSLLLTRDIREGRAHLDRTLASYDPAEHRQLA